MMTGKEFKMCLSRHNISRAEFCDLTGISKTTVDRYCSASGGVPYYIRLIMRFLDERGGLKGL